MKSYRLYYLATLLLPLLPQWLGYWLCDRAGDLAFLFAGRARSRYVANLKHVLGPNADPVRIRQITHLAFQNLVKNYYDLLRSHRLTADQLRGQLQEVIGFEQFENALAEGKGVIAGSAHIGNFNLFVLLAGLYLREQRDIIVPVERLEPPKYYELVRRQRASQGVEIVPVDQAARTLVKKVRSGNIVGLALDMDVTHTGPVIDFFGAPAQMPDGAVALALKYKVPLICGYARRLPNNKCIAIIEPPLHLESTGDLARDTRVGMERVVRLLERWICEYPEQWLMFEPIWKE
jgi:KDO2-lipid IV(A) lauroyltransferase